LCHDDEPTWKTVALSCCDENKRICVACLLSAKVQTPSQGIKANRIKPRCPFCRNEDVPFRTVLVNAKLIRRNQINVFKDMPVEEPVSRAKRRRTAAVQMKEKEEYR
jgi:hypothetical protein